jgi:hypothetical protein
VSIWSFGIAPESQVERMYWSVVICEMNIRDAMYG